MKPRKRKYEETLAPRDEERAERWARLTGRTPGQTSKLGNTNCIKHGIVALRFMGEEEKPFFEEMIARFREEFTLNTSVDFVQLELACVYFLQLIRAILAENWEIAERLDAMMRRHLGDLKTTKKAREGESTGGAQISPAEWSAQLLERIRARQQAEAEDTSDVSDAAVPEKTPETVQRTSDDTDEAHA